MAASFTADEGRLYVEMTVLSSKMASLDNLIMTSALEDTIALCQTARLFLIDGHQNDLENFWLNKTRIEGSKNWHEYLQNIVNETKAKYVKRSRLEALENKEDDEHENMDEENFDSNLISQPTQSGFGTQFNQLGHHAANSDAWGDSGLNPNGTNHMQQNGETPFQHTLAQPVQMTHTNVESQKTPQMTTEPRDYKDLHRQHKIDEKPLPKKKKQLFVSDSEDEENPKKASKAARKHSSESQERYLGKRNPAEGSPVASIGFSDLGEAPAFTF